MDSVIYSINYRYIGLFLWEQKINLLISLFLALSIYSYFYKVYLKEKRKRQLKDLLKEINELFALGTEIETMKEKTMDELEHASFNQRLDSVVVQMNANNEIIIAKMNTGFELVDNKMEAILKQTTATNGRVTKIELESIPDIEKKIKDNKKETDSELNIIRFFKKRKLLTGLIILGAFKFFELVDIQYVYKVLKGLIL